MEWIFADDQGAPLSNPAGNDRKFTSGALDNRTFLDVAVNHPNRYLAIRNMKFEDLGDEGRDYVDWGKSTSIYFTTPDADAEIPNPKEGSESLNAYTFS